MVSGAALGVGGCFSVQGYVAGARAARNASGPGRVARIVALASVLFLTSCGLFADTWQWNQKLTVEVLVDGKVVSGSAVSHVWWREANAFDVYPSGYKGEATVVDLGPRGQLFALIGEGTKYIAQYTLHDELGYSRGSYEKLLPAIMHFRGTRDVPHDRYPLLVTFADASDPRTLRKVNPERLSEIFGLGVTLKGISLEITDEKVTAGTVEKYLGWLREVSRSRGTVLPDPPKFLKDAADIQLVSPENFGTEIFR